MSTTERCARCSTPIDASGHALRFGGQLYHPGCLIQHRVELRSTAAR